LVYANGQLITSSCMETDISPLANEHRAVFEALTRPLHANEYRACSDPTHPGHGMPMAISAAAGIATLPLKKLLVS